MTTPASTFELRVPVRWAKKTGDPVAWLGPNSTEVDDESEAIRFVFRDRITVRDRQQVPRIIDEINGGPAFTHDLEQTRRVLRLALEAVYEDRLWPDGRPEAQTAKEEREQTAEINRALREDLARRTDEIEEGDEDVHRDAVLLDRVQQQITEAEDLAEMVVRLVEPHGLDLVATEWEPEHLDALIGAYREERIRRRRGRADPGNGSRSAA